MISSIFKAFGLIDAGASAQQRAFMADIKGISTEHKGDADEYTARVNGNVDMTFSRKLPTFYAAEAQEVFLTDVQSLYEGQGNVQQALKDIRKLAFRHKVDVTVEVAKLVYRSDDDFARLAHVFQKAGFKQNQAHPELFMLEYESLRAAAKPAQELKPA